MKKNYLYLLIIFGCTFALAMRWFSSKDQANESVESNKEQVVEISPKKDIQKISTPTPVATRKTVSKLGGIPIEVLKEQSEDPSFLPFDANGNIYIENVTIDGDWATAQGDLLVGTKEFVMKLEQEGASLQIPKPRFWSHGIIPYSVSNVISSKQQQAISAAIKILNTSGAAIQFVEATNEKDRIIFTSGGSHCYSYVGRIGGEQEIVLGPDCMTPQILHELMHTLGFYHEQSRPDRDEFIMIMWENIEVKYQEQFKKMPPLHFSLNDVPFDYTSIMMYPPQAFSRDPSEPSMLTLDGEMYQPLQTLSPGDLEKLKSIYGEKN